MKKTHIILAAVMLYLIIIVMGGSAYYAYTVQHNRVQAQIALEKQQKAAAEAKKTEQTAKSQHETKPETKEAIREKKLADLKADMKEETINGIVYYRHEWPRKLASGVYLRPFIAVGNGRCVLKNDVYYFYSIADSQSTAWIFGDRLDIYVGGELTTLSFNPQLMRKHMASDAEWLAENYVVEADADTIAAFKRIANAKQAYIVYYKEGGKARRHDLTTSEIKRVREMVQLYELLNEE